MDKEELLRRYELAKGSDYAAIRQRAIDYIVTASSSTISPDHLRGMLLLIKYIDGWVDEYMAEIRKRKEQ